MGPPQDVPIEPSRAFTLFEGCPQCKGTGVEPAGAVFMSPGDCEACKGEGYRRQVFDTAAELQAYVATRPTWA